MRVRRFSVLPGTSQHPFFCLVWGCAVAPSGSPETLPRSYQANVTCSCIPSDSVRLHPIVTCQLKPGHTAQCVPEHSCPTHFPAWPRPVSHEIFVQVFDQLSKVPVRLWTIKPHSSHNRVCCIVLGCAFLVTRVRGLSQGPSGQAAKHAWE